MDCNKEEAIRAKDIAEEKMRNKDFSGALKVAAKAQKLFQDLENISQMIMVCDVHCAADKKLFGNEMDWYAILKVEPTADEATIKKQYRKFALQLHPDKNKFPGAEAAFKLISDAQRTLLDQGKRSAYDMKRKVTVNRPAPAAACRPPQKPSWYPHATAAQNNFRANFPGLNSQQKSQQPQQQPTQTGFSNDRATFWTKCPHCTVRHPYHTELLHKSLHCQTCNKTFFAYDSGAVPQASNRSQPKVPQQRVVQNQGACKVDQGSQKYFTAENVFTAFSANAAPTSEVGTEKVNGKRGRKQTVESRESSSESKEDKVVDDNGDVLAGKKFDSQLEQNVRRSGRHKQHVSYMENLSDEEGMVSHPKKAKGSGSPCETEDGEEMPKEYKSTHKNQSGLAGEVKEDKKAMDRREGKSFEASIPNGKKEIGKEFEKEEARLLACPEPEFNDFDKDKKEGCFAVGQIWALYDPLDALPRFYARIRKVFSSGFKLRITWLEPDPDDENEIKWVSEGLPVSCGKFKHGDSENTEDRLMFSHLLCWEKETCRGIYKIYPRKGETWAVFKNWNIKWKSDTGTDQKYEYEFVEILSEDAEGVGIHVAYLTKVKGFVSVFCQLSKDGVDTFLIPPSELFRFSHRVPSFVLSGKEGKGLPKGSFELDPASLPEEIVVPKDLKVDCDSIHLDSSFSSNSEIVKPMMGSGKTALPDSTSNAFEIPESEFYNFDTDKSPEKFVIGQIWALYCDEDGLPKYYGEIKKIESKPVFKIHVRWLLPCISQLVLGWYDTNMPSCCGRFRIKRGSQVYTSTDSFSHKLKAEPTGRKDEYAILPRKGEIWALYRNWTPNIKCSDLENWEYDIGQVIEETEWCRKVLILERVGGFNSVFKPQVKGGSNVTIEITQTYQLRFSHQIPSFQLTEERNGSLRGFWELDPAALPVYYFSC
ncbi:uncharacterized protein LOC111279228 [Durio zibethinus]|uniref:Uncharacterized protein LOC111279228 n=1 Tax=Durio zibethinus TaxID=66656 RepID=A0A6P5X265_DURZI|nr:uncharacterized protein LOC111279228 [Durio zibethinus]XP_022721926.1 uncharacterized protein LOC111279228 [Durio zibethinus]